MTVNIKPDTPLSVLLHLYPESETILKSYIKKIDFTSVTERVKTIEDISREEEIDLDELLNELREKLGK